MASWLNWFESRIVGMVMVGVAMAGVVGLSKITPTGLLPRMTKVRLRVVQLGGASIGRTTNVVQQIEEVLKQEAAVADYSATIGLNFIDNYCNRMLPSSLSH